MKQFTRYNERTRKALGLPDMVTSDDLKHSLETSGVVTDHFKVMASKLFNVEYCFVTPAQREAGKRAVYLGQYK